MHQALASYPSRAGGFRVRLPLSETACLAVGARLDKPRVRGGVSGTILVGPGPAGCRRRRRRGELNAVPRARPAAAHLRSPQRARANAGRRPFEQGRRANPQAMDGLSARPCAPSGPRRGCQWCSRVRDPSGPTSRIAVPQDLHRATSPCDSTYCCPIRCWTAGLNSEDLAEKGDVLSDPTAEAILVVRRSFVAAASEGLEVPPIGRAPESIDEPVPNACEPA